MPFDFAALKARTRQIVHDTLAVEGEYTHPTKVGAVTLRVRWHNKLVRTGELLDTGYAEVLEGVDRVIFNRPELHEKSVVLTRGGQVRLTDPRFNGAVLVLDSQQPIVGPVEEIWMIGYLR